MPLHVLTLDLVRHDRMADIRRLIGREVGFEGGMVRLRRDGDARAGVIVAAHTDGRVDVAIRMEPGDG